MLSAARILRHKSRDESISTAARRILERAADHQATIEAHEQIMRATQGLGVNGYYALYAGY